MEILVVLLSTLATTTTLYVNTGKQYLKWLAIMDMVLVVISAIRIIRGKDNSNVQ